MPNTDKFLKQLFFTFIGAAFSTVTATLNAFFPLAGLIFGVAHISLFNGSHKLTKRLSFVVISTISSLVILLFWSHYRSINQGMVGFICGFAGALLIIFTFLIINKQIKSQKIVFVAIIISAVVGLSSAYGTQLNADALYLSEAVKSSLVLVGAWQITVGTTINILKNSLIPGKTTKELG